MTDSTMIDLFELILVLAIPTLVLLTCRYLNKRWDREAEQADLHETSSF